MFLGKNGRNAALIWRDTFSRRPRVVFMRAISAQLRENRGWRAISIEKPVGNVGRGSRLDLVIKT